MIETTIAGIWHSHAKSLLTFALIGGSLNAFQAQIVVDTPDLEATQKALEVKSEASGKEMIGVVLPLDLDFFEAAMFVEAEGRGVWSLELNAPGALATCLYFDNFHLPVGSELRFETPSGVYDKTWVEGPLGAFENNDARRWTNNEVPGEAVLVTYECPLGVTEVAALEISGLGYFARHQNFPAPWSHNNLRGGGSAECQIDVNCPEGGTWEDEKNSVVRLRITTDEGIGLCTGAMVNNTARDCRQLMLSAFHCVNDLDADDWDVLKVQYNYEYFECGGISSINSRTRTGVTPLTDSNDMPVGNNTGSDFVLCEVNQPIPEEWQPYYAGWDASGYNGTSGVSIHHPNGDRKKISTFTSPLTSGSWLPWTSTNAHWRVIWSPTETDHGVTEGGSSGSPIFEENHRIIGTLTGGGSYCSQPYQADLYGKMSYHWDGPNPIPTSAKLKAFLDPAGTGEEFMDGSYVQMDEEGNVSCGVNNASVDGQVEEQFVAGLKVSPNPSAGMVRVVLPVGFDLAKLQWFDSMGRSLGEWKGAKFSGDLDLSAWGSGVRYVTVTTKDGWSTTRRVVVQ